METSPVGVNHTRNMTKAEDWINPLRGYKYDSFNHDVLRGMRVENGEVVTRDGMRYKALVIPQARKMNPDNINTGLSEIEALRQQGAIIIDKPWTASDLSDIGIERDIQLPAGLDYTHRHDAHEDIYFISNQTDRPVTFEPKARASRNHHYLFDPMKEQFTQAGGSITLLPFASVIYRLSDDNLDSLTEKESLPRHSATIEGEWTITFESNGIVLTDTLRRWETYDDPRLKYYSGHVAYEIPFRYKGKGKAWVRFDCMRFLRYSAGPSLDSTSLK